MDTPLFYKATSTLALLFVLLTTGCTNDNDTFLKRSQDIYFYSVNNELASQRLYEIMYNREDTAHPIERFKLVHISDAHLSKWSSDNDYKYPNNLLEAVTFANQKRLKINALVASGDHIGNMLDTPKEEALLYLNAFVHNLYKQNDVPTFSCTGNHDSNMLSNNKSDHLSKQELNNVFIQNYNYPISSPKGENYYYSDIPNPMGGFIRIIALDMTDQDTLIYDTQHDAIFSQQQIDWLCNTALKKDMSNEHSIVVLTHYPFHSYSKGAYTYLCDGDFVHEWTMIPTIIEAFRNKGTLKNKFENKNKNHLPIEVYADFTATPGEFICYLGGHIHATVRYPINGLSNASASLALPWQHMLLSTNLSPSEMGVKYNKVVRLSNSLLNNSFCIYAFDTKQKKVYITFFGANKPSSQENYPEIQSFSYL